MEFTYTLNRTDDDGNDIELEVTVIGEPIRAMRGSRDRWGCPLEPDEPATFEINSVTDEEGNEIELTDDEYTNVVEAGANAAEDAHYAAMEDAYEARRDAERYG